MTGPVLLEEEARKKGEIKVESVILPLLCILRGVAKASLALVWQIVKWLLLTHIWVAVTDCI